MTILLKTELKIEVSGCDFQMLTLRFLSALSTLFTNYVTQILLSYFEQSYQSGSLQQQLGVYGLQRKTTQKKTKFKTLFGDIWVPQIQVRVQYEQAGKWHQKSITRDLLGVSKRYQIPDFMKALLGWIGSMTTYRVGHSILGTLTNFQCSLMSLWGSVQHFAKRITLQLSKTGTREFEADGTGIPTKNTGKRGSELKKVFQRNQDGSLHLVGISIGKYKSKQDWKTCLYLLKEGVKQFKKVILASDGDTSITDTAKAMSKKVKLQRDIWHVFHQLKYYLWKDGVAKALRSDIIGGIYKITMLKPKLSVEQRLELLQSQLVELSKQGYHTTVTFLQSAMEDFYTYESEGNNNKYTSKTERSMRTTNQRINVGVWSEQGALNATKIRLAYYYNGIEAISDWCKAKNVG